jgi:tRNA 5-methylaminomethyl-2-thiouridine biosynthesis bifunctional protein
MYKQDIPILWKDGQPYSAQYEDVYFSSDSGIDETHYVFIQHNQLEARFSALTQDNFAANFTVAETGFGTGLNFLCTWQTWDQFAPETSRLNFISTELHPLSLTDLTSALELWPPLARYAQQLIEQYQHIVAGWHHFEFDHGRVTLTLLIGDANDTLANLHARVDAWFLDGFSPAKNEEMWQQSLFESMAKLSHEHTTFATFTSAGHVRRGLETVGFNVQKAAGFGKKREMLFGRFSPSVNSQGLAHTKRPTLRKQNQPQQAIVIGGGIAGAASSHALAKRGWQVVLIERHAALAQEASGNPAGVLYPRLTNAQDKLSQFALAGYLFSLRQLQGLDLAAIDYQPCGVLQLAFNAREQARCKAVLAQHFPETLLRAVSQIEASELAGVTLNYGGLLFPAAGWVNPAAWCAALTNHPNISVKTSTEALRLEHVDNGWQVWDAQNCIAEAPIVIIACANDTIQFTQSQHCALQAVRGQITLLPASAVSQQLKTVVCSDGYITPAHQQMHCLGATFSQGESSIEVRETDHLHNFATLEEMSPMLYESLRHQSLQGRVALRSTTRDYFPVLGQLLDTTKLGKHPPRYNDHPHQLPWLDGLYVNAGHGSKGLISAPLCAELLASIISSEPAPVPRDIMTAMEPNRFALREMGLKLMATRVYDSHST